MQSDLFNPSLAAFIETLPRVSSSKSLVVYTAVTAGYDKPTPPPPNDDIDYVCFTDAEAEEPPGWRVVRVTGVYRDPRRTAKLFKMLPHVVFPTAPMTLWVDGTCVIKGDPMALAREYLSAPADKFVCFAHPRGGHVRDEREACLRKRRDEPALIQAQAEAYEAAGFPDDKPLVASGVLLRRSLEPDVIRLNESWLNEVDRHSARDQLSFNFVAWREKFDHHVFRMALGQNSFCTWQPHTRLRFYDGNSRPMHSVRALVDSLYGRAAYQIRRILQR